MPWVSLALHVRRLPACFLNPLKHDWYWSILLRLQTETKTQSTDSVFIPRYLFIELKGNCAMRQTDVNSSYWQTLNWQLHHIIISPSMGGTPLTPPLGVGGTRASGLDLVFSPLCGRTEAVEGIEAVLSKTLLAGVTWRGVTSALLSGVDLLALMYSASSGLLAWADSERRPAVEGAGSAVE